MKGAGPGVVFMVVLLVGFTFAVSSMVAGMGSTGPTATGPGGSGSAPADNGTVAASVSQIGQSGIALFIILAVFVLEAPFLLRSKNRLFWELVTIGASVVAALIAIVFVYGLSRLPEVSISFGSGAALIPLLILGLAIAGSVVAGVVLVRSARKVPLLDAPPLPKTIETPAAGDGPSGLLYGQNAKGARGAIIACFARFCSLLVRLQVVTLPSTTAREIADEASRGTRLDASKVARLTSLFERARYDREEVTEEDAAESRLILRGLEAQAESGKTDSAKEGGR